MNRWYFTLPLADDNEDIAGYLLYRSRLALGSSRTGDNLDKFASNDGLTGTVVQNLELVDHVAGVLGCVLMDMSAM
jgi:hypothetical protein